ncbi:uncharacterized protein DS421_5g170100 [Arachis hypogaea]|nr:uncharacterized protein LOC112803150 isoform X1 [Arachis hypogaea]QHO44309.1 uncharacterized protein DS421_5g170100 [Arachis hypogaea]
MSLWCSPYNFLPRSSSSPNCIGLATPILFSSDFKPLQVPSPSQRFRVAAKSNSGTEPSPPTNTSFLAFLCPLLKLFSGGDPSKQRNFTFEVATSSLATLSRFPWGTKSKRHTSLNTPVTSNLPVNLQLFEFEACPFCRRVREALTELDLSVEVYPCPKGSVRHREVVRRTGGKEQFPFLIDQNCGVSMYESGDIVKYLFERYGEGRSPSLGLLESTIFTGWMPTILRAGRGMTLWERSRLDIPPGKLELFSYENNPYARIVREALCELELPYTLQNVGEGSRQIKLLLDASGSKEVRFRSTKLLTSLTEMRSVCFQIRWLFVQNWKLKFYSGQP